MNKQKVDACEFSQEDILKLAHFFEILMSIDQRINATTKDQVDNEYQ